MSAVKSFEINLLHDIDEQYQYEPGELLHGHVVLVLDSSIKIKAIQIQVKGESNVSWEDSGQCSAQESYIDLAQNLVENATLEKGKHKFPLEYALPLNLPTSFIGKLGSVTYVVKATLKEDKNFGLNTLISSEPFLICRRSNINKHVDALKKYDTHAEKRMWGALAFCISGKVHVRLSLNKRAHLPGEDIILDADITNESPRVVKSIQASMVMVSTFLAKNKSKSNTQVVNKKEDKTEISYGDERRWKGVHITIPPYIPESKLECCDIINIQYELVFKAEISGGNELNITIPLIVGSNEGPNRAVSGLPHSDQYIKPPIDSQDKNEEDEIYTEIPADEENYLGEDLENFRYPIQDGETRRNPVFDD